MDQFRHDADGDFLGRLGADGKTDGAVHFFKITGGKPVLFQGPVYGVPFFPGPDHADIACRRFKGLVQNGFIMKMAARQNDEVTVRMDIKPHKALIECSKDPHVIRFRKPAGIGEFRPIIQDHGLKTDAFGKDGCLKADMAGPKR